MPSFLWSTVNTHERQPVELTGRWNTPYAWLGDTWTGARLLPPTTAGEEGRSMMAICGALRYFRSTR
jgi:hypothetical protein